MHHPHLVAVQHSLQDLLDAVAGKRKAGVTVGSQASPGNLAGEMPYARSSLLPGHTWNSPGISLTVILPGHDVLKQLPTSDPAETSRVTLPQAPSAASWERVSRKLRAGPEDLRTSAPKGGALGVIGMSPTTTPFLASNPPFH